MKFAVGDLITSERTGFSGLVVRVVERAGASWYGVEWFIIPEEPGGIWWGTLGELSAVAYYEKVG